MVVNSKRKIIKSKTSNLTLVEINNNRSNAEINPQIVKKRLSVDNEPMNMSITIQGQNISKEKKPTPPPRVGRKRFLTSVLKILSKSTTATQYPDQKDPRSKLKKKIEDKKNPTTVENEEMQDFTESKQIKINIEPEKKKKKFRSKILNNDKNYADKFEVVKLKKEIRFSPIESSSKEEIKWSDFPKLVKDNDEKRTNIVNNIVKEISEGRKKPDDKIKVHKDPSTLVAEAHKNDKKLYNFFVDLLESTFSLYNVKDAKNKPVTSVSSSKVAFEIDETVAQKLKVNKPPMFDDVTQKPSKLNYNSIKSDHEWNDEKIIDYFTDEPTKKPQVRQRFKSPGRRRKIKSESFSHPHYQRRKSPSPSSRSAIIEQKSIKKPKKRNLLNILKEQLAQDNYIYEEPQNLYDALKVIARNKRKCQKTLRFSNVKKYVPNPRGDNNLKKRKVTRQSSTFRINKRLPAKSSEVMKVTKNKRSELRDKQYDTSVHSIEVYGFDYNYSPKKFRSCERKKEVSLPYHSSTSDFDCDF